MWIPEAMIIRPLFLTIGCRIQERSHTIALILSKLDRRREHATNIAEDLNRLLERLDLCRCYESNSRESEFQGVRVVGKYARIYA